LCYNEKNTKKGDAMTILERAIAEHERCFFENWDRAFSELRNAGKDECKVWLVGPSSYLFSIRGVKFAVDLQVRRAVDLEALADRLCDDLSTLSFVLITHQHDDHFCVPLINMAARLPIVWYLPREMPEHLRARLILDADKIRLLSAGDSLELGNLRIKAFSSPHVRPDSTVSLPELGYLINTERGTVLIPGDVRDYDYRDYPELGDIDLCISHLWAGDNAIDKEEYLPKLEKFVDFSLRFNARRYFICHLYEIGRKEKFMWHSGHAETATRMFKEKRPESNVDVPIGGRSYELFL
jgi:hypothetical protein